MVSAGTTTQGVDTVFGYPCGAIMPVMTRCMTVVQHVLCRHEQGAVMAAIGDARQGRKREYVLPRRAGRNQPITGLADALLD
ncbi:thiamine pyrophosphate-binding protein [Shigella flexneri]